MGDNQINKLTGLIGDLLDVSKVHSGQLTYQDEKIDFNELIKEIADEMQHTAHAHKIEFDLAPTAIIDGDRNRLGQVIMNLISNAIKYSPKADKVVIRSLPVAGLLYLLIPKPMTELLHNIGSSPVAFFIIPKSTKLSFRFCSSLILLIKSSTLAEVGFVFISASFFFQPFEIIVCLTLV